MTDADEFLAHYGVKGMKWGVIRERDTASRDARKAERAAVRQEKRETKAKTFDSRARDLDARIQGIKSKPPANYFVQRDRNKQVQELTKLRDTAIKDAERKRQGKLTSGERKVVIGASIVAALIAAKIVKNNVENGEFNRISEKGKAFLKGETFAFKKNAKFSKPDMDADELYKDVLNGINPDFGKMGTTQNCRRATFTYEMRRRGYDVRATRTTNASGQNTLGLLNATRPGEKQMNTGVFGAIKQTARENRPGADTPMAKMSRRFGAGAENGIFRADAKGIFEQLAEQPDGSRGELGVMWSAGGGHSMIYEIVKGKPVIFDGQTNKVFKGAEEADFLNKIAQAGFTRLDNKDLNMDYLMRWMKNV